ncbi:MAG: phosphatidate cytidylyltransferase [Desulfovermiculus sp.]
MTSHQQRLVTAGVLIALLAGLIFAAPFAVKAGAVALVCAFALVEFWGMFWLDRMWLKSLGLILALPLVLAPWMEWAVLGWLLAVFWLCGAVYVFWGRSQKDMVWSDAALVICGLVYIPCSLQFALYLSQWELLLVLGAVFASDTGAFYAGSKWGKHKLCPGISPQKTWEGSVCGLAACIIFCLGLGLFLDRGEWLVWIGIGVALNVAAQLGDLFESALKRELGVKDSGGILPGHGGVLDRVDSLLLAVPVYMAIRSMYPLLG